jgi:hypothetical protein
MDNFVQKTKRYNPAPIIFAFIGLVGVILGLGYFYSRSHQEPAATVQAVPRPLTRPVAPRAAPTVAPKPAMGSMSMGLVPQPPPAAAVADTTADTTAPTEATAVTVEFDLATKDVMERLSQEGEGHLDIGNYSASVVPHFKPKYDGVHGDSGFRPLGSDSKTLNMGQPSVVFLGGKEPKNGDEIGFFVEVTPVHTTERGMEYKISIKRSLPEFSSTGESKVSSQEFEQSIVIPREWGVVIAGLLPRKPLIEGEDKLYETNVLKALSDPAFQKGDDEFLLILNPY